MLRAPACPFLGHHNRRCGRCDFEKVQGLEGIYITNEQINADASSLKEKPKLRTKITFDKGGKWQMLKAPFATNVGKEFACRRDESSIAPDYSLQQIGLQQTKPQHVLCSLTCVGAVITRLFTYLYISADPTRTRSALCTCMA